MPAPMAVLFLPILFFAADLMFAWMNDASLTATQRLVFAFGGLGGVGWLAPSFIFAIWIGFLSTV